MGSTRSHGKDRLTNVTQKERTPAKSPSSTPTPVLQLDPTWINQVLNFHGGVYNQLDYSATTPASDGSVCIISDLLLRHG